MADPTLPTSPTNSELALEVIKHTEAAQELLEVATNNSVRLIAHMDSAEAHGRGDITGNAGTATKLETAQAISLTGDFTAPGVAFDGSGPITLTATLSERAQVLGSVSGAVALNFAVGLYIAATIAGATTFSAPTPPAGGCATVLLELTNGGNFAVTWGMGPRWSNGVAPVLTANGVDLVALTCRDGRWIGALIASNVR